MEGTDIVIDQFEKGIAKDPYSGFADMRNVNISGSPGEASVNFLPVATQFVTLTGTATLTNAGDTVAFTSGGSIVNGMAITVGTSVGGLTAGAVYYIVSAGGGLWNLALKYNGTAVTITGDTTTTYATVNLGLPVSRTTEISAASGVPVATYYILDANGRAWVSGNSTLGNSSYWTFMNNTTLTSASGQGMVAWKGYLFVFRNALIDVVATSAAPVSTDWTYGWKTMNSNNSSFTQSHFALVGQDDIIYYCDVSSVGSILQNEGQTFAPGTASTYTFESVALPLPSIEVATCLGEIGQNLLVGGVRNFVYPWNRIDPNYSVPILTPESTTTCIASANNVAYLFCGNRGRIYATNNSNVQEVGKVPDHLTGSNKPYFYWKDAIWLRNKIFFSFSASKNVTASTPLTTVGGVWSIDLDSKALQCENVLSYGTYAGFAGVLIAQFIPLSKGTQNVTGIEGEGYYAGWWDGTNYGVDSFTNAASGQVLPYSGYEAYIDTEKIPVGTFLGKRTFSNMEFKLGTPLVSGEKIKILYRVGLDNTESPVDATAGYTLVGETTFAANTISDVYPVNFEKSQWLQLRARLSSVTSGTAESFVRLKEIRLRSVE